ncbi:MAG TPA: glucokinase, partial [Rhodocyclaceae bacterium]|nr:glucokinase [Rhodocyclaceae bacterium]
MSTTTLLGGDLGGTKTLMALVEVNRGYPEIVREKRYASGEFDLFEEILADFVQGYNRPVTSACLGVAGPIDGRRAKLTYLPWQ